MSGTTKRFQLACWRWSVSCFGLDVAQDTDQRNHRFLEEALELVQACGCEKSEALQLVDYVYGRPKGQDAQEVGGVMVTLAVLCTSQGIDLEDAAVTELERIREKIEEIRAKQATKPQQSPLPGISP